MPNHVNNAFTAEGDPKLVQDFINKATQNGETEFSFQNLYPMPDELNITSGSETSTAIDYYKCIGGDYDTMNAWIDRPYIKEHLPELADLGEMRSIVIGYMLENISSLALAEGKQAIINMQKYGCQDWYSWANKHWGTKWDCYDVEDTFYDCTTKDGIRQAYWNFTTAWDMPRSFVRFLANSFPKLKFSIEGLCESGWKASLVFENGKLITSQYLEADQAEEDYR